MILIKTHYKMMLKLKKKLIGFIRQRQRKSKGKVDFKPKTLDMVKRELLYNEVTP